MVSMVVARRFRGPSTSGNGGYTAGLLAAHLVGAAPALAPAAVSVRLHTPPPLDTALTVETADGGALARHGDTVVARAQASDVELDPVPPVPYDVAVEAAATYAGLRRHPFPECVVCGPARTEGDGMRLFPGLIAAGRTACPWTPDSSLVGSDPSSVNSAVVWAALDCPGGWTADLEGRPMVLGTITVRIAALPRIGEQCVVTGALRSTAGRRTETSTSLYGDGGRPLAHASAVWVAVDAAAFNRMFSPND